MKTMSEVAFFDENEFLGSINYSFPLSKISWLKVGGPVDVAVISKGDGFVWIRRKNYFDSQDNYKFFNKYKRHGEQEII